jgi:DNA-binding transcriptional regulator YdaS (Cro superfamily)
MGEELCVCQPNLNKYFHGVLLWPYKHAIQIIKKLGGKVTLEELRSTKKQGDKNDGEGISKSKGSIKPKRGRRIKTA